MLGTRLPLFVARSRSENKRSIQFAEVAVVVGQVVHVGIR